MKKALLLGLVCVMGLSLVGCNEKESDADAKVRATTESAMNQSLNEVGYPSITNWNEKRQMRRIYELRDQANLGTYSYIHSLNGELVYIGRSLGYGIPASVQFSNPQKVVGNQMHALVTQPLPEPNGMFMPEGLSATWLSMVNPVTGEGEPVYIEQEITVSPFPLPYAKYPAGTSYAELAGLNKPAQ